MSGIQRHYHGCTGTQIHIESEVGINRGVRIKIGPWDSYEDDDPRWIVWEYPGAVETGEIMCALADAFGYIAHHPKYATDVEQ